MTRYQYRKSIVEIKRSYDHLNSTMGISYSGKMTSLYWIRALVMLSIQCRGYWWPGDRRSQNISGCCIDLVCPYYSIVCMWRVNLYRLYFNSLARGGVWRQFQISKFQTHFIDEYFKYFLWNCYQVNATTAPWSLVNIGSGNGLVPSGNKPLPEPMLT